MKKARLGFWMVAFALALALTAASSADAAEAKKVINLNR